MNDLFRFTETLVKIRNRHSNVVETMAQVGVMLTWSFVKNSPLFHFFCHNSLQISAGFDA